MSDRTCCWHVRLEEETAGRNSRKKRAATENWILSLLFLLIHPGHASDTSGLFYAEQLAGRGVRGHPASIVPEKYSLMIGLQQ